MRLLFLGRLEDLAGGAERSLALARPSPLAAVIARLEPRLAEAVAAVGVRAARNGELLADHSAIVSDCDEIAFLPPVSGG